MPTSRYPDGGSFESPAADHASHAAGAESGADDGPVAFCADLSPASVVGAYRRGIIPLPVSDEYFRTLNEFRYEDQVAAGTVALVGDEGADPYWVAWWSPDPRPVIGAGALHLGRKVRKRLRRDELTPTADTVLGAVAEACREGREPRWLTDPLLETLTELHRAGWAHSFEVWRGDELVGGAMGIGIDGLISGDSLFGRQPGAAAIAVADMSARLVGAGGALHRAQGDAPLLRSLGAVPMSRERSLQLLDRPPQRLSIL